MADRSFKDEVTKLNLELAPRSGAEIQSLVETIYATATEDVKAAKGVLNR
jgi:septation ring formation regulator EzrA